MPEPARKSALDINPRDDFAFQLSRLARHWRWWLDNRLSDEGLSQATWITLTYLSRGGDGMTQRELADFIGIQGPTLVRHLDNLESKGLAERRQKDGDRRVRTVHLTEAAHPVIDQITERAAVLRRELLAGIDDQELATCISVFARVMENSARSLKEAEQQTPGFFD